MMIKGILMDKIIHMKLSPIRPWHRTSRPTSNINPISMLIDPFNGLTFRYLKRPRVWFTKEIPKQIELFWASGGETSAYGNS